MTIATFTNLDPKDFNLLIKKCTTDGVQCRINKVRQHIVSVAVFNPNVINVGKWIERHGYDPMSLDIRSKG